MSQRLAWHVNGMVASICFHRNFQYILIEELQDIPESLGWSQSIITLLMPLEYDYSSHPSWLSQLARCIKPRKPAQKVLWFLEEGVSQEWELGNIWSRITFRWSWLWVHEGLYNTIVLCLQIQLHNHYHHHHHYYYYFNECQSPLFPKIL